MNIHEWENVYIWEERLMSRVVAKAAGNKEWRKGRGFSMGEIQEAGLSMETLRKKGVMVDTRRKTMHNENLEELLRLKEKL